MSARCSERSFTPGVSTSTMRSRSSSAGYDTSRCFTSSWPSPSACAAFSPPTVNERTSSNGSVARVPEAYTTSARGSSAYSRWWITAVVGVTPEGSTRLPSSAFTNVLLPWLNSPTTTRWKRSASSFCTRSDRIRPARLRAPMASPKPTSSRSTPMTSALRLWKDSSICPLAPVASRPSLIPRS